MDHRALAVARQERDPQSALHGFRRFMQWRSTQPALRRGDIRFIDAPEPVLAFTRSDEGQTVLALFNLGAEPVDFGLPFGQVQLLDGHGLTVGTVTGSRVHLPGHALLFAHVQA